jgi:O-antigen/teichoic acid export membrane protein
MPTQSTRVARNAAASYLRFFVSMTVMFLLTPVIIRHVGKQDFALWSLTFSVLGFFGLLDMGFSAGVVRYVAECRGADDPERRNRMVSTLAVVYVLLTLVAACGLGVLSAVYTHLFKIPLEQQSKALALLWILAARSVLFALPLSLFQGILFGEQRIALLNSVQMATTLLYGVVAWIGLAQGAGLMTLAWLNLIAMLLEYGLYVCFAYRCVPDLRIAPRLADRKMLRSVASFSLAQFVVSMAALVRLRTDPLIVQWFLPLSQVAVYAIALRIAESALLLTKQGINVLSPLVAQLHGAGDTEKIRTTLLGAGKLTFCASVLLTVPICVFAHDIVVMWVGPAFAEAAPTLVVLMISMCLITPQLVASNVLAMTGHHRLTARAEIVGMLLNLIVSIALARRFGLVGVALGTLTSTVLVDLFYIVSAACRLNAIPFATFARRVLLAGVVLAVVQTAVTLALKGLHPHPGVLALTVESLCGALPTIALFWFAFLEPAEKERILGRYYRARRKAAAHALSLTEGS